MKYNLKDLKHLIEQNFHNNLSDSYYEVKEINANKLLTHTRFDLAFKLLYLEMKNKNVKFSKEIYIEHIKAFSFGKFIEPGNKEKNTIEKFIKEFNKLSEDIKINGFDSNKTLIPLSRNLSIANGAHRVASAIYANKSVKCVEIKTDNHIYDYKFFYNRNVSGEILDAVATKYVEYANKVHIAFLWPTAKSYSKEIEKIIPNIVYKKDIKLNLNGAHNLLSQVYYGEEWLGSIEDNFKGSQGKLVECFKSFEPIRVIVFQADNLCEVMKIKDRARDIVNIGKHSIHITDTTEEAIRTARMVFNDNSVHFLNYAKPNKYLSIHTKIAKFKEFIKENGLEINHVLLSSDILLEVYGLKETKETEFFYFNNMLSTKEFEDIEINDSELEYHNKEKVEIIFNPKYYFYFNDIKFISFSQLYRMKINRAEEKDINDCNLMEALIENNIMREYVIRYKQKLYYSKIRFKIATIEILKFFGIYNFSKYIYKNIRRSK